MSQDENAKTYPRNFTETIIKSIAVRMTCRDVEYKAMKEELAEVAAKKLQKLCERCGVKCPRWDRSIYCRICTTRICTRCSLSWDEDICKICAAE